MVPGTQTLCTGASAQQIVRCAEVVDSTAEPPAFVDVGDRVVKLGPSHEVTRIVVMSEVTLPLAEIKKRLSEIVDGVEGRHDRVVLTRNGRPAAVILSPDDLEALEDTLDLLSDPKAMRAIRKAEADIDAGKAVDAAALRATYLRS